MARPFSPKEAKEAVQQARELLDNIVTIENATKDCTVELDAAIKQAKQTLLERELKKISIEYLAPSPKIADALTAQGVTNAWLLWRASDTSPFGGEETSLKKSLDRCCEAIRKRCSVEPVEPCANVAISIAAKRQQATELKGASQPVRSAKHDLKNAVDLVDANAGTFHWILLNKEQKQETKEAYDLLQKCSGGSLAKCVDRCLDKALVIQNWGSSGKVTDQERNDLVKTVNDLAGQTLIESHQGKLDREKIKEDLNTAHDVLSPECLTKAKDNLAKSQRAIEKAINKKVWAIRQEDAEAYVYNQPVEILKDMVQGVRIKSIKDAGNKRIADLFLDRWNYPKTFAPRSEDWHQINCVEAISGISYRIAEKIVDSINKNIDELALRSKIRLSADNRQKNHGELLVQVYSYLDHQNDANKIEATAESFRNRLDFLSQQLAPANSPYAWLMCEDTTPLAEPYRKLDELLDEESFKALKAASENTGIAYVQLEEDEAWERFSKNPIEVFNLLEKLAPEAFAASGNGYGLPQQLAEQIKKTSFSTRGLKCELRTYQTWGVRYILHQGNTLLGDEMGLGKTIQAIAVMTALRNRGAKKFLVICPASVIENWNREIQKHSDLTSTKIHGNYKLRDAKRWMDSLNVGVTNYENAGNIDLDPSFKLDLIVCDEAHYIKNPQAKRTKNTLTLCKQARHILFMTGTPLENKVEEMIGLISYLKPKIACEAALHVDGFSSQEFREALIPVYYRRKREDVLSELPELIENSEWCGMGKDELEKYCETLIKENYMAVRRVSWNVPDASKSSKLNRLREIVADAKDDGRKVLVFSYFLDTIEVVRNALGDACCGLINGSVPLGKRQRIIDDFDAAPTGSVLVAQIQSGGTGLNIQSASVVVICEPQYKPSIENQAISRAYRMGQSRNVLVYRLLCKDSIDERITQILANKQRDFDTYADKSAAAEADLENNAEIKQEQISTIVQDEIKRLEREKPQLVAKLKAKTGTE